MDTLLSTLRDLLKDPTITLGEQVQNLWSGYGQIIRITSLAKNQRFIVKVVAPTNIKQHPRGWNTTNSHQRKLLSYQVECCFYQNYAALTDVHCQTPRFIASTEFNGGLLLVIQDLGELGFTVKVDRSDWLSLKQAIQWLAHFHVNFMGNRGLGLWPIGTYWHLDTRLDEWHAMPSSPYKEKAKRIADKLARAKYQTLVHGDAKFANLCFYPNRTRVAAVDFQYTGLGSGVKDLAYLVGSCLDQSGLNEYGELALEEYICQVNSAAALYSRPIDLAQLELEIRGLYPVAWADFYRFLLGWNPQSWKICRYMREMAERGLDLVG